ncbi:Na(+)/H(+)-K(+) antiporter GerN [Streptomyces hundungensis]|uniref:Na(+)/H(+)-K(+) antiporter GerN n=1 Tax=Streptomyces hundungensis TaxID=1077946 RepID=A0A387HN15_9ACTN|nr:cation:proton antiporter [Streptomyces hundungensis]AYG84934.1 Na(+)/H(+)-K(+) antiporter GerN [Streptomyces hundungensis]
MTTHQTAMVMVDLALVLMCAQVLGRLARWCGQPAVIGEILAGILLGPTLFHGALSDALFPFAVRPMLSTLGDLGIALFMFLVGLELDHRLLRGNRRAAVGVSVGSIVCSFGLGSILALWLWNGHAVGNRLGFVLFIGAAMSITAFPVLARILTDRGIQHTRVGALAMASAAVGDVVAWLLLAAVLTFTGGQSSWLVLLVLPYAVVMFTVVRPLLGRFLTSREPRATGADEHGPGSGPGAGPLAVLTALLLVSGALSERLGLHFIFGAFLAGAVVPRHGTQRLRAAVADRFETITWMLLPAYFTVAGLKVDLSTVDGDGLGELGLILLVAIGGKLGGAYLGARAARQPGRGAMTLGILMNTRGLTELVILGVGLQLHLIDTDLYSLMVVMALVTTALTAPLLRWAYPRQMVDADLRSLAAEWEAAALESGPALPVGAQRSETQR